MDQTAAAASTHVQAPQVLQGDAEAQAVGSAGVLGDVAADGGGRLAGGIGREVQAPGAAWRLTAV